MDKLFAIKIKYQNGTYSDAIPIGTQAQNVEWIQQNNTYSLVDILGSSINVNSNQVPISLQTQINDKVSLTTFQNYMDDKLNEDFGVWLAENEERFLKKADHLKYSTEQATYASNSASNIETRQYPVVLDSLNKLSVNVPWTDTIFNPKLSGIWTATMTSEILVTNRIITLDNSEGFFPITRGKTIAVYNKNAGSITRLYIEDRYYPVYIQISGSPTKMENVNQDYLKNIPTGYIFFTYIPASSGGEAGFLLTSANTNLYVAHALEEKKANINSPDFTGTPTAPTASAGTNTTQIATTEFVQGEMNDVLKQSQIGPTASTQASESPSTNEHRQYPVVFDSQGKLSVNVPWGINQAESVIQKIWTGYCNSSSNMRDKIVYLDNSAEFDFSNGNILILRMQGNIVANPRLDIYMEDSNSNLFSSTGTKNIVYYLGDTSCPMDNALYYNWGKGTKIFIYYDNTWILHGVSQQSVNTLDINKVDKINPVISNPTFTNNATFDKNISTSNSSKMVATTKFVHDVVDQEVNQASSNILNNIQVNINNAIENLQTDINNFKTEQEHENAILEDVLVSNTQTLQLTNLASLQDNNWTAPGLSLVSQSENLRTYQYSYRSSIINPSIQYNCSLDYPLIGFKYKISLDPQFSEIEEYPVSINLNCSSVHSGVEQLDELLFTSNKINEWISVSFNSFDTTNNVLSNLASEDWYLSKIKFSFSKEDYDYSGNIIFEIKDFFIYSISSLYTDQGMQFKKYFLNKIIDQQNNLFQNGTVTYSYQEKKVDDTLSIQGVAADAATVGKYLKVRSFPLNLHESANGITLISKSCYRFLDFLILNFTISINSDKIDNFPIFRIGYDNETRTSKTINIVMSNIANKGSGLLTWDSGNTNTIRTNGTLFASSNPTYYYCNTIIYYPQTQ